MNKWEVTISVYSNPTLRSKQQINLGYANYEDLGIISSFWPTAYFIMAIQDCFKHRLIHKKHLD